MPIASSPPARRRGAPARPIPASDVSTSVGLVGLATLLAWIAFCRAWPQIAPVFGADPASGVLSGPLAALAAMALTGLAMGIWSVVVDKVHLRPSTGIDWSNPRPIDQAMETASTKIAALWVTYGVLAGLFCLGRWYWDGQYLFSMQVLGWAAIPLFVLCVPYVIWLDRYMIRPRDHAWHFGAMLLRREAWDPHEVKKHWRAWIIKGFFSAFMISILPFGFRAVVEADFGAVLGNPVMLGVLLFELLFVIDVQIGTVGYLLTLRPLDAHIRSGNPFLAGWVAALLCYPPFVFAFMGNGGVIQYENNTAGWGHWFAGNEPLLWAWAAILVALTAIYAWATVAFGIRFSNLTYRGVLTHGPYRFTRHPAYLSKNLFWWLSVMPFITVSGSTVDVIRNTIFLGVVSGIYYWRAKTEEAHLLGEDEKYRDYFEWMNRHGIVTAPLHRLLEKLKPKGAIAPQPAE
ncbi:methyltransferase family protein [Paraurantiacibacter namhicola]|nr:DUF1295 domain-containing protein [Paraurantiacibacter namhicola]